MQIASVSASSIIRNIIIKISDCKLYSFDNNSMKECNKLSQKIRTFICPCIII